MLTNRRPHNARQRRNIGELLHSWYETAFSCVALQLAKNELEKGLAGVEAGSGLHVRHVALWHKTHRGERVVMNAKGLAMLRHLESKGEDRPFLSCTVHPHTI